MHSSHGMHCFMWHVAKADEAYVQISNSVHHAMYRLRAASSGDEQDICVAKMAGTDMM